ncbi:MAG: RNA methyltransferase [Deltaproteobacteria bacterium]|nr:RNA methyltransferase [Deltaproteobacteria bacterium]
MHPVAFVFHELRSPENLGSIARAMKNFGVTDLVLAAPLTYAFGEAEKLAVKSADLLDRMRVERELPPALGPYVFVAGTTSRTLPDRPSLNGEQLAKRLHEERQRGPVAVLFGSEKRGLSDAELDLCQAVVTLPSQPPQPSINVAQSAAIIAYEIGKLAAPELAPAAATTLATRERMEALFGSMQKALLQAGFLNPQNPEDILDELRRLLDRAQPSEREAQLLLTAFAKLDRALKK